MHSLIRISTDVYYIGMLHSIALLAKRANVVMVLSPLIRCRMVGLSSGLAQECWQKTMWSIRRKFSDFTKAKNFFVNFMLIISLSFQCSLAHGQYQIDTMQSCLLYRGEFELQVFEPTICNIQEPSSCDFMHNSIDCYEGSELKKSFRIKKIIEEDAIIYRDSTRIFAVLNFPKSSFYNADEFTTVHVGVPGFTVHVFQPLDGALPQLIFPTGASHGQ